MTVVKWNSVDTPPAKSNVYFVSFENSNEKSEIALYSAICKEWAINVRSDKTNSTWFEPKQESRYGQILFWADIERPLIKED